LIQNYVRLATPEDIDLLIGFMKSFHKVSPYRSMRFDTHRSRDFLNGVIKGSLKDHVALIALKDGKAVGFLVGGANQPVFSQAKIAVEMGWWIDEEHRNTRSALLIFQAYEDWAFRIGCSHIQAAYLPGVSPPLERFYEKRGYVQVESSFLKTIRI